MQAQGTEKLGLSCAALASLLSKQAQQIGQGSYVCSWQERPPHLGCLP